MNGASRKNKLNQIMIRATITFKTPYGSYKTYTSDFNSEKHIENYIEYMMRKREWKETGTIRHNNLNTK